jgi:hypothetical protein
MRLMSTLRVSCDGTAGATTVHDMARPAVKRFTRGSATAKCIDDGRTRVTSPSVSIAAYPSFVTRAVTTKL